MESNRDYISHSQYALFNSSPKGYYEKYVLNKAYNGNKYQNFGKKLMEDLEFGEVKGVPKFLKDLVKNGIVEKEITAQSKFINKDLFGIIDVIDDNFQHFCEIKTGKVAWTESKVLKDEQMLFYALMINLKYKIIPRATLVWAETIDFNGGVEFTGKVKTFKRGFTLEELVDFAKKLGVVVNKIADYEHTVLDVDNSIDTRLLKLMTEKKRIDEELDLLKSEIMVELQEFENKYATSENFNITLASRKSYTYSESLTDKIKKTTDEIKKEKTIEEKNGVATVTEKKYLLIKAKK